MRLIASPRMVAAGLVVSSLLSLDVAPAQPRPRAYARRGEVCALGSRHRLDVDHEGSRRTVARPCARGLRCCYPCGIAGCDSICLRDCGPPRP